MKIYIAGKITGDPAYWEKFLGVEFKVQGCGHVVLNPARLPSGMTNADYMRICFAMIDTADLVLFLPDAMDSRGAQLERQYCEYTGKPFRHLARRELRKIPDILRRTDTDEQPTNKTTDARSG